MSRANEPGFMRAAFLGLPPPAPSSVAFVGPPVPGTLELADVYRFLGHVGPFDYYRCICCGSEYPATRQAPESVHPLWPIKELYPSQLQLQPFADIRCNGHSITLCPWCRVDSKPWTAGRGA